MDHRPVVPSQLKAAIDAAERLVVKDAPLDDANIARFTNLLEEMSGETQFLIITHSRKTMRVARVLYGVTMEEAGVSKIVSVQFNGAAALPVPEQKALAAVRCTSR